MSMEVLSRHWEELKKKPNYLNVALGTKFKGGKDTGVPAIVVYVSRKVPASILFKEHWIPSDIEGVPTDVVELAPTTWKAGKTGISQLHPEEQRRKLGAKLLPKAVRAVRAEIKQTGLESSWKAYASPVRNQAGCGCCVGEGSIGHTEVQFRIAMADPTNPLRLSVAQAFFCAGGSCASGLYVPALLNWLQANGVCPESYLPFDANVAAGNDEACNTGVLPGWQNYLYKISSWTELDDINDIRQALMSGSLIAVFAVHQSFFNYVSGVYKSLGASDPIAGYHCVVNLGIHDSIQAYDGENSWDVTWGEAGFFQIAYGESEFDNAGWKVVPVLPPPNPPAPPPAPPALAIATNSLPSAYQGTVYSAVLQATGGTPPYNWVSGSLPDGLVLSSSGVISGTPTGQEIAPIIFVVTDSTGATANVQLTLTINPAPSPTPTPSPCKVGNGITKVLNVYPKLAKRKGSFMYMNPGKKKEV